MPSQPGSHALYASGSNADNSDVITISLPSFAQVKAKRCFCVAAVAGAAAVGVALLAPLAEAFAFFVYALAITLAAGAISVLKAGFRAYQGALGEDRVVQALSALDDRHVLIRNWVPPGNRGDVDLLLLGPFGALVLEVKTYAVPVALRQGKWRIQDGKGRWRVTKNFSAQLQQNVRQAQLGLQLPTEGLLVFNDRAVLTLDRPVPSVLRRSELLDRVLALPNHGVCAHTVVAQFGSLAAA